MPFAAEAAHADHEVQRKPSEPVSAKEAGATDATPALGKFLSTLGADGENGSRPRMLSSPVMRHRANGEMRAHVMRQAQQGLGNHKTQRMFSRARPTSLVQRQCACGGKCSSCQDKSVEEITEVEESKQVQRQASGSGMEVEANREVIPSDSPGHPLDHGTRGFMESRFGTDFSDVRVHTDSRAAQSADALAANAYTTGRDIYFAAGRYAPGSRDGQHLLAHELTHTVQQGNGAMPLATSRAGGVIVGDASDPLETEADTAASAVVDSGSEGLSISSRASSQALIQRDLTFPPPVSAPVLDQPSPPESSPSQSETPGSSSLPADTQTHAPEPAEPRTAGDDNAPGWFTRTAGAVGRGLAAGAGGIGTGAKAVGGAIASGAKAVGGAIASGAQAVGGAIVSGGNAVGRGIAAGAHAVASGVKAAGEWLETEAGILATKLARSLGVNVSVTPAGLEIIVPEVCPIDAIPFTFNLPPIDKTFMVRLALPLGPVLITGGVGLAAHIKPTAQIQVGPVCLKGMKILIDPATGTYSLSSMISATAAASLAAELRGGVRGELGATGLFIDLDLLGVEGGLAGKFRAIGAGTLIMFQSLSSKAGIISVSGSGQLNLGLAGDLFLGAYAQLEILGENACRIFWQPYEWHGDIAGAFGISAGVTIIPGLIPRIIPRVTMPTFDRIPFDQIPLVLSRQGFSEDCPVRDKLCNLLRDLNLLPSQNGGSWSWSGPYGPGPRLPGPREVYAKNPGIPSGSECRGACGPNCDTCQPIPVYLYTDPVTGDLWQYANFQDCNSNVGCREHDAAFDWAADVHGETGRFAIIKPWHMAANVECTCNNLVGNCIAWIAGGPPYDMKMYFADSATLLRPGGGGGLSTGSCHADYPNAPDCVASFPDRDAVLDQWGRANKIGQFRDCSIAESWTAGGMIGCDGAPGNIWHCRATDVVTGEDVTVSIMECICCKEDDTSDSEWRQPQIVVEPGMSEELILELCERNLIARVICIPVEAKMIKQFGDSRRDLNLNPDKDPKAFLRPDDAPIIASFKGIYNRLDSWNMYIWSKHQDLFPEFESKFTLAARRDLWLRDLKEAAEKYKTEFKDLSKTDTKKIENKYTAEVLGRIQAEIDKTNHEIAEWYKKNTGSTETIEEIIERVHTEGTELWRADWRRAILQVNRVLARLWPPAQAAIVVWIVDQRSKHPGEDLSGDVGELDYTGSLATGFKGPPKQQIRFNPEKFDVDANLEAPPLEKYAVKINHLKPHHERIFGRQTTIDPLNKFSDDAHTELAARVDGYDASNPLDKFDVAIAAHDLPEEERRVQATNRLYKLRPPTLDETKYKKMLDELNAGGYLKSTGREVRDDLTDVQFSEMNAIMDRYEK